MIRHRWEVFFITQRPATEGQTVQRQTQRWLVEQGFDLPSVLVISGSRRRRRALGSTSTSTTARRTVWTSSPNRGLVRC